MLLIGSKTPASAFGVVKHGCRFELKAYTFLTPQCLKCSIIVLPLSVPRGTLVCIWEERLPDSLDPHFLFTIASQP